MQILIKHPLLEKDTDWVVYAERQCLSNYVPRIQRGGGGGEEEIAPSQNRKTKKDLFKTSYKFL